MLFRFPALAVVVLLAPGVGFLIAFFGFPLVTAVAGSFGLVNYSGHPAFTLQHYQDVLFVQKYRDGLFFSLYLAALSLPLSVALLRTTPGRHLFGALFKVPMAVPGIVAAFFVLALLDKGGVVDRLFRTVGLSLPDLVGDRYGVGVIIAMSWKETALMTLIIGAAFAAISDDVVSAARTVGAGPLSTLLRIRIPLALPGITAATLIVFVKSVSAFAEPTLLGPIYPQALTELMVFDGFQQAKWGLAFAMGTLLSFAAIVIMGLYFWLTGGAQAALVGERE